jgi:hypothetical protein
MRPKRGAKGGHPDLEERNSGFYYNPSWIERQVSKIDAGNFRIKFRKGKK